MSFVTRPPHAIRRPLSGTDMTGQSRDDGDQRPPRALVCVLTFDNMLHFDRFDRDEGIGSQMYITSRFLEGGGGGGGGRSASSA